MLCDIGASVVAVESNFPIQAKSLKRGQWVFAHDTDAEGDAAILCIVTKTLAETDEDPDFLFEHLQPRGHWVGVVIVYARDEHKIGRGYYLNQDSIIAHAILQVDARPIKESV